MCNVQYVSSAERCRFSIAHCSLLIGGVRFRGSMREKCFRRILSMNHRCFPRRFRATADWRETKSEVALNLWGNLPSPEFRVPMRGPFGVEALSPDELSGSRSGGVELPIAHCSLLIVHCSPVGVER